MAAPAVLNDSKDAKLAVSRLKKSLVSHAQNYHIRPKPNPTIARFVIAADQARSRGLSLIITPGELEDSCFCLAPTRVTRRWEATAGVGMLAGRGRVGFRTTDSYKRVLSV